MGIYDEHLNRLVAGNTAVPPVVENLELGTISEWRQGYAKKIWQVNERYFTAVDLFGGYLAAMADQMLALASVSLLEDGQTLRTTNLEISFFKPVTGGTLIVEGQVVHKSKQVIHAEVTFAVGENELAAKARGVLHVVTRPSAETAPERKIRDLWDEKRSV